MKYLPQYVAQRNAWAAIFKNPTYDINNLSASDIKALTEDLECDLSPENLCCDGELRGAALIQKSKMLRGALAELEQMA